MKKNIKGIIYLRLFLILISVHFGGDGNYKGRILASGSVTWLYQLLWGSKQLIPQSIIKLMVYYSLSTLMLAGILDIPVISAFKYIHQFEELLDNDSDLDLNFFYNV